MLGALRAHSLPIEHESRYNSTLDGRGAGLGSSLDAFVCLLGLQFTFLRLILGPVLGVESLRCRYMLVRVVGRIDRILFPTKIR